MTKHISYSPFEAFRPHFNTLTLAGYSQFVKRSVSPIKLVLQNIYINVVLFLVVLYNLQHILRVIQVRESLALVVDTLFILLTTLNTMGKQMAFKFRKQRIEHIISVIDGPLFAPRKQFHLEVMKQNAVTMRRILRFYIGCVLFCGGLWTMFPLVNKALGFDVQFTAYFPFDTSYSPIFQITVAYMSILITLQAIGNVTMDCTIVAFYAQARVQMQVLGYNLQHLMDEPDEDDVLENKVTVFKHARIEDNNYQLFHKRFVRCVIHYRRIKWLVKEIEEVFAETLLFQLIVTAWVICMTVYKIVGLSMFSAEFVSMAMYLGCILAQFFIYCYYGTQVKSESDSINTSVYCSEWLSLPPRHRRGLLIMMTCSWKPITPRCAYIIPISLETYISILRASYTLFTFLDRK